MMIKIQQLCTRLTDLIGEETLVCELEGILRKHQGIALRTRKPGRVGLCLAILQDLRNGGKDLTPRVIAEAVMQHNLSPPSLYRLVQILRQKGIQVRAVDILQEQERMKAGIY